MRRCDAARNKGAFDSALFFARKKPCWSHTNPYHSAHQPAQFGARSIFAMLSCSSRERKLSSVLTPRPIPPLSMAPAGTGTGLAPLYGIVHEALRESHQGPIHLFHGGVTSRDLYCVAALRTVESLHPQFHYHAPCLKAPKNVSDDAPLEVGPLDEVESDLLRPVYRRSSVCGGLIGAACAPSDCCACRVVVAANLREHAANLLRQPLCL